jgi:hypothetical protein
MKTLTDQDSAKVLQAYNGLKRRKMMLEGVGMSDQEAKKVQLIKRLTNKPFDLQCQAFSKFIDYLKWDRRREQEEREQFERDQKEKERIIRRIMNKGLRDAGMAFRQSRIHTNDEAEKERILMFKQRGIMRKMSDVSTRLMGMGFNKLVEEWKAKQSTAKDKLRFLIKTLTDQDSANVLQAYNALKKQKFMMEGVGLSDKEAKKSQLLKRLTNKGFDLTVQGWNKLIDFNKWARQCEKDSEAQHERDQKEKERIIKRIMNKGLRDTGTAFRQALIFTNDQVDKERMLMFKQRGIMRKILDTNTRLMGMGFNKLLESWKSTQATVKSKMKFILQSLTDKDKLFTLQAYNGLKSQKLASDGIGSSSQLD